MLTDVFFSGRIHAMTHVNELEGTMKLVVRTFLFWDDKSQTMKKGLNPKAKYPDNYLYSKSEWPEGLALKLPRFEIYGREEDAKRRNPEIRLLDSGFDNLPFNVMLTDLRVVIIPIKTNLRAFPVDTIQVPIKCWFPKFQDRGTFALKANKYEVKIENIHSGSPMTFGLRGKDGVAAFSVMDIEELTNEKSQAIEFCIPLKRQHMFWVYRYIFPEGFITLLAFGSIFAVDVVDRISTNLALLLALITLNVSAVSQLPKLPYLSLMDYYHYVSIFIISGIILGNCFATVSENENVKRTLDIVCYSLHLFLWLLMQIYSFSFVSCGRTTY